MTALPLPMLLRPNPLQRLTGLTLAQGSCQFPFPKDTADSQDLQNAKNKGDQTQLEVSPVNGLHFVSFCASCTQILSRDCLN